MKHRDISIAGAVVYWTISGQTNVDKLEKGLDQLGLAEFAPNRTPNNQTLADSLSAVFAAGHADRFVRPLKTQDGFCVVEETRGDEKNRYRSILSARVDDNHGITYFEGEINAHDKKEVREHYDAYKDLLRGTQVSASLTKIVTQLRGIRLRPSGSIYWLPEEQLATWKAIAETVEKAGPGNTVYDVRTAMDDDTVRAVCDAIIEEANAEAARIEADVESGELGAKALNTRVEQAKAMRAKVAEYEKTLGRVMKDQRTALDKAEQAAAMAALLALGEDEKEDAAPTTKKRAAA